MGLKGLTDADVEKLRRLARELGPVRSQRPRPRRTRRFSAGGSDLEVFDVLIYQTGGLTEWDAAAGIRYHDSVHQMEAWPMVQLPESWNWVPDTNRFIQLRKSITTQVPALATDEGIFGVAIGRPDAIVGTINTAVLLTLDCRTVNIANLQPPTPPLT